MHTDDFKALFQRSLRDIDAFKEFASVNRGTGRTIKNPKLFVEAQRLRAKGTASQVEILRGARELDCEDAFEKAVLSEILAVSPDCLHRIMTRLECIDESRGFQDLGLLNPIVARPEQVKFSGRLATTNTRKDTPKLSRDGRK
jgi:hypothetical protein